jgi:hypothetical protein
METSPRSADNMGIASALTALNVVVASGFSMAGLIKPELVLPTGATTTDASAIFAMYAAARTMPLALVTSDRRGMATVVMRDGFRRRQAERETSGTEAPATGEGLWADKPAREVRRSVQPSREATTGTGSD